MNTEYTELDQIFNAGWNEFVQEMRDNNDRSNFRLLKLVEKIKGELFVSELKILLKRVDYGMLHITRTPIGMCIGENRFATIQRVWVGQKSIDGQAHGSICVEVKQDRWIVAEYTQ